MSATVETMLSEERPVLIEPASGVRRNLDAVQTPGGGRWTPGVRHPNAQQLRLLAKVARMYHEGGLRQPQIAEQLNVSQARVSRLLKKAVDLGVVRTVVTLPSGVHTDLEDEVQRLYGLRDVVVVDAEGAAGDVTAALAAAAAAYLDTTLTGGDGIGISSWSSTLLAAVDAMEARNVRVAEHIVQLLGGVGNADVQIQATRLTGRLADLTGARPIYMSAPGLLSTPALRRALLKDGSVNEVTSVWDTLTMALLGIGSLTPSPLLRRSGNAVATNEQEQLRTLGAVGDVCLRFFDAAGKHVHSSLDQRVVGITPAQLRRIPRRVAVAGGAEKFTAIRAAALGGWANILITDLDTAEQLIQQEPGSLAGP